MSCGLGGRSADQRPSRALARLGILGVAVAACGFVPLAGSLPGLSKQAGQDTGQAEEVATGWALAEQLSESQPAAAARAAAKGLEEAEGEVSGAHQQLGYELVVRLAALGQYAEAEILAAPLHGRVQADWSAGNLALVLSRAGRFEQADRVLREQLPRATAPAELWNQRALLASGQGRPGLFRARLGRAIRLGSANAALSLARADALAGRPGPARAGYRSGCDRTPPGPWSLRGWALTLLP